MRLIDGDALVAWIKESQQLTSKIKAIICYIKTMPTIYAVSEWIPCSESLPEEQGQYLVTFPVYNGESCVYVLSFCKGKFYETDDEYGDAEYDDVIAWMPLPEPWKGANDD